MILGKKSPEKWSRKSVPGKMVTQKMSFKIVLRQKNARKFKRLFYLVRLNSTTRDELFQFEKYTSDKILLQDFLTKFLKYNYPQ